MNIRTMVTSLLPLVATPLLAGCIIETGPAPATAQQGQMEMVELDATPPIQMAAGLADGRPARLHRGAAMSYWVWQGAKR